MCLARTYFKSIFGGARARCGRRIGRLLDAEGFVVESNPADIGLALLKGPDAGACVLIRARVVWVPGGKITFVRLFVSHLM